MYCSKQETNYSRKTHFTDTSLLWAVSSVPRETPDSVSKFKPVTTEKKRTRFACSTNGYLQEVNLTSTNTILPTVCCKQHTNVHGPA